MKSFFLIFAVAATLAAQEAAVAPGGSSRRITAVSQFFDHDFVNVYAFANGVWDSRVPTLNNGVSAFGHSLGYEAGGGVAATHSFKGGDFTVNYRGSYRDYQSSFFGTGNNQSLALGFDKQLNRRWKISSTASGAMSSYGSPNYFGSAVGTTLAPNPFSSSSRFFDVGTNLSYRQTKRLSWVVGGSYFLSNYNFGSAFSSNGFSGTGSMLYSVTPRTSFGVNYSHTYYTYSLGAGSSNIDGVSLSMQHKFSPYWQLDLAGGVNRSNSKGTITQLVSAIFNGQVVTGYATGAYDRTVNSPSFQGGLTHFYRHSFFSVAGGQSILAGNGVYLTSRNLFGNTVYSFSTRRTNVSFGANYSRLSSVANNVSQQYATSGASASYGINLARYVSANLRYDFIHYDNLYSYQGLNDNRATFGLSLSSKSVPLTLF